MIFMKNILVTGAAGFIGFHLSRRYLNEGCSVTGLDNLNAYYDVTLKKARLSLLEPYPDFRFMKMDLADRESMTALFADVRPDIVVHLAAQAGVRYSLINPHAYTDSNITGFLNILEGCRHHHVKHLIFASSSSVYGANTLMPFSAHHNVDHPISLYAATKKANELMAHSYAALFAIPSTGLRFFTVYGPWGRPDMALFLFTRAILEGRTINVFNEGKMKRDFTYIDDIIEGVFRLTEKYPEPYSSWSGDQPDPASSFAPYKIYNIGNNNPVDLLEFIHVLEGELGKKAKKQMLPLQPGDVPATYADIADLRDEIGFKPETPIKEGIKHFVKWYKEYYNI